MFNRIVRYVCQCLLIMVFLYKYRYKYDSYLFGCQVELLCGAW